MIKISRMKAYSLLPDKMKYELQKQIIINKIAYLLVTQESKGFKIHIIPPQKYSANKDKTLLHIFGLEPKVLTGNYEVKI